MSRNSLRSALVKIGRGYVGVLRTLAWAAALIVSAVALGAVVVFPLWYFATHDREGYTIAVGGVCVGAVLWLLYRRLRSFFALPPRQRLSALLLAAAKVGGIVLFLIFAYLVVGLFVLRLFIIAVPAALVYLAVLGYVLYVRTPRSARR